jgi:hypothetical protein
VELRPLSELRDDTTIDLFGQLEDEAVDVGAGEIASLHSCPEAPLSLYDDWGRLCARSTNLKDFS